MRLRTAFIAIFLTFLLAHGVSARQRAAGTGSPVPVDTVWQEAPALFPALVALPEGYDSTRTWPAILALHGFGGTARGFARIAPVFTKAESERARDMLRAAGYRVTLQPFDGGHSVPTAQLEKVVEWLRSLR